MLFSWHVLNIVVVSVDNDDDDDDVNDVDVDPNAGVVIGVVGRDVDQGEIEPSLETTCGCGFTNCKFFLFKQMIEIMISHLLPE